MKTKLKYLIPLSVGLFTAQSSFYAMNTAFVRSYSAPLVHHEVDESQIEPLGWVAVSDTSSDGCYVTTDTDFKPTMAQYLINKFRFKTLSSEQCTAYQKRGAVHKGTLNGRAVHWVALTDKIDGGIS